MPDSSRSACKGCFADVCAGMNKEAKFLRPFAQHLHGTNFRQRTDFAKIELSPLFSGGEGGIRTRVRLSGSVSCRFGIPTEAKLATVAVDHCPVLPAGRIAALPYCAAWPMQSLRSCRSRPHWQQRRNSGLSRRPANAANAVRHPQSWHGGSNSISGGFLMASIIIPFSYRPIYRVYKQESTKRRAKDQSPCCFR